jgi:hypothetical protein
VTVRKVPSAIIDLPEIRLNESMTVIGKQQRGIYATDEWQQWAERGPRLSGPLLLCSGPKTSAARLRRLSGNAAAIEAC